MEAAERRENKAREDLKRILDDYGVTLPDALKNKLVDWKCLD